MGALERGHRVALPPLLEDVRVFPFLGCAGDDLDVDEVADGQLHAPVGLDDVLLHYLLLFRGILVGRAAQQQRALRPHHHRDAAAEGSLGEVEVAAQLLQRSARLLVGQPLAPRDERFLEGGGALLHGQHFSGLLERVGPHGPGLGARLLSLQRGLVRAAPLAVVQDAAHQRDLALRVELRRARGLELGGELRHFSGELRERLGRAAVGLRPLELAEQLSPFHRALRLRFFQGRPGDGALGLTGGAAGLAVRFLGVAQRRGRGLDLRLSGLDRGFTLGKVEPRRGDLRLEGLYARAEHLDLGQRLALTGEVLFRRAFRPATLEARLRARERLLGQLDLLLGLEPGVVEPPGVLLYREGLGKRLLLHHQLVGELLHRVGREGERRALAAALSPGGGEVELVFLLCGVEHVTNQRVLRERRERGGELHLAPRLVIVLEAAVQNEVDVGLRGEQRVGQEAVGHSLHATAPARCGNAPPQQLAQLLVDGPLVCLDAELATVLRE